MHFIATASQMLNARTKRRADYGKRAKQQLTEVEAAVADLSDEDLLDFADIFDGGQTFLAEIAVGEMAKRGISLYDTPQKSDPLLLAGK